MPAFEPAVLEADDPEAELDPASDCVILKPTGTVWVAAAAVEAADTADDKLCKV